MSFSTTGSIAGQSLNAYFNSNTIGNIFTTGGNVGIGATSPTYTLDVAGASRIQGTGIGTNGALLITGSDSYGHGLCISSNAFLQKRTVLNNTGGTGNLFAYDYSTSSSQNLILQAPGGNVGIGIGASSPVYSLDVAGTLRINANNNVWNKIVTLYDGASGDTPTGATNFYGFGINPATLRYQAPIGASHIFCNSSSASLTISSSGNIGINTTSPSAKLNINSTVSETSLLISSNDTWQTAMTIFNSTVTSSSIGNYSFLVGGSLNSGIGKGNFGIFDNTSTASGFRFTIATSGNIGIGTTSPSYTLDINGSTRVNSTNNAYNKLLTLFDSSSSDAISGATNFYGLGINGGILRYQVPSGCNHTFYASSTGCMQLSGSGTLTVIGDIGAFGTISDQRLKTNVIPITSGLQIVTNLTPVTFTWKDDIFNIEQRGKDDSGFIAQEVEKILPHAVGEYTEINSQTNYKNMRHERIIPYLVSAIQELEKRIKQLEAN